MFKIATQRGLDIRLSGVVFLLSLLAAVAAFSSGGSIFRDTQAVLVAALGGLFLVVAAFGIQIHRTAAHTALGVFLLTALAASATSVWQMESLQEVGLIVGYFLIFLLASNLVGSNRLRLAAHLIVLASVGIAVIGLYQHLISNVKQLELLRFAGHAQEARQLAVMIDRAFANFASANSFAGFLVLIIPVALGLLLSERDIRLRIWTVFALATLILALYFTFSKGGLLALSVALSVMVVGGLSRSKNSKWFAIIPVLGLAVGTPAYILFSFFQGRLTAVAANIGGRVELWGGAWELIMSRPVLGSGPGTFGTQITKQQLGSVFSPYAHNTYLQIGVETGLLGLGVFILVAGTVLVLAWKRFTDIQSSDAGGGVQNEAWLRLGLVASVAGFFAHNVVDYTWYVPGAALVFWFIAGLGVGPASNIPASPSKPTRMRYVLVAVAALSLVPVLMVFAGETYRTIGDSLREDPHELSKAKKFYQLSLRLFPYNAHAHDGLAQTYYIEALTDESSITPEAIGHARAAVALRPTWAYYQARLADQLGASGQEGPALRRYRKAIALYPNDPKLRVQMGSYVLSKRAYSDALPIFHGATMLGKVYHEENYSAQELANARQDVSGPLTSIGLAYFGKARSYLGLGKYEMSLKALKKAEGLLGKTRQILYLRAQALEKKGSYTEAAGLYKLVNAEMATPDPEVTFRLANALEGSGQREAALGELEKILETTPDYKPALKMRDRMLVSLAD